MLGNLAVILTQSQVREFIKSHLVRQIVWGISAGIHMKVAYDKVADEMVDAVYSDDPEAALKALQEKYDIDLMAEIERSKQITGDSDPE